MDPRVWVRTLRNELRRRGVDVSRTDPDCPPYGYLQLVIFPMLRINCIIDVGASQGEFAGHMRDYGYTGRIVSFEPESKNYEILREKASFDEHWITHQAALGEHKESGELHVARGSYWHSLLGPAAYGLREFGDQIEVIGSEPVQVQTLDEVYQDCVSGIADPRVYLKLDTQGYDRHVLLGAQKALPAILALQTEISFQQEYEGMTPFDEMIRFLEGLGYSLSGIFKVVRDRHLALAEADGVFVHRDIVH